MSEYSETPYSRIKPLNMRDSYEKAVTSINNKSLLRVTMKVWIGIIKECFIQFNVNRAVQKKSNSRHKVKSSIL